MANADTTFTIRADEETLEALGAVNRLRRDTFAAAALTGLLAGRYEMSGVDRDSYRAQVVALSFEWADAMLAESDRRR